MLITQNDDHQASQALLELFRTAREVPSAEFIVVDNGSSIKAHMVKETLRRIGYYFGVTTKYIHHSKPIGYAKAIASGEHACIFVSTEKRWTLAAN